MKKILFILTSLIVIATGCSSSPEEAKTEKTQKIEAKGSSAEKLEKETKKVKFDKPFTAKTSINPQRSTDVKMTVSNYQIVQNMSTVTELNDKYDYAQLDVSFENTGNAETSEGLVSILSFKFYDTNGVEIEVDTFIKSQLKDFTYKEASVRPGGKNSGRLYFPIPKGSKPGEIVYLTNSMSTMGSNEYVFNLK